MNKINISPLDMDLKEYNDIRTEQTGRDDSYYRLLKKSEIAILEKQSNICDNWGNILVTDYFIPEQIKSCSFRGKIRIDKMEKIFLEFRDIAVPVGLYNSKINSCDIGVNCYVNNVSYISRVILGETVILSDIDEFITTKNSKFGNGVLGRGETENKRVKLEIANEAGGREILPFENMLMPDAYIWYKYRSNSAFLNILESFTDKKYRINIGYFGIVGDRTVIKSTRFIKDVNIGSDAYIKGCNKLKNLTIKSLPDSKTQIGEGCELVNGVIGEGCRIFYGVMAVRFQLMPNSSLKYGARLINSVLGENSTISCCEVLNSFIFPGHEQHHNSSFLIASVLMGQTNIASGVTIGSNHNSRKNDGEIIAGRGFWPGLNCSLKHNSKFASYNIILKGTYLYEINNPFPFSLVSLRSNGKLQVYPGYWFLHNMYALRRNSNKYKERDKRCNKFPFYEYDFLAPDTVEEMLNSLKLLEQFTEDSYQKISGSYVSGREILENYNRYDSFNVFGNNIENKNSEVLICKPNIAYSEYKKMINFYGVSVISGYYQVNGRLSLNIKDNLLFRNWSNIGGQLVPSFRIIKIIKEVTEGIINSWDGLHKRYEYFYEVYRDDQLNHAYSALLSLYGVSKIDRELWDNMIVEALRTSEEIKDRVINSRMKDYKCDFRKITFDSGEEMDAVLGKPSDESFFKIEERRHQEFIALFKSRGLKEIF